MLEEALFVELAKKIRSDDNDDVVKGDGMMMTRQLYMLPPCGTWGSGCCHKTAEVWDGIQSVFLKYE